MNITINDLVEYERFEGNTHEPIITSIKQFLMLLNIYDYTKR